MPDEFNPILNNPYEEPQKHYFTNLEGVLDYDKIEKGRRAFIEDAQPIPVKQNIQPTLPFQNNIDDRAKEHIINILRREVGNWRKENYPGATRITKELLHYWFFDSMRQRKLFFAQREAIETTIWLNEIADKTSIGAFVLQHLKLANTISELDPLLNLPRIAFKIATGGGKTVVMAMQILYHFFNRREYGNDVRYADYFLILTPGITIKDRLGVLYVDTSSGNAKDYYRVRDLVPSKFAEALYELNSKIIVTNRHSLECKSLKGNKISCFDGKKDTAGNKQDAKEDFDLLIKREFKKFKKGKRLLILNDEGHHCYYPKVKTRKSGDDENTHAAVWFNGIVNLAVHYQIRNVYDLSATPYYISGSGYEEYTLFPWVVSDFGLVEAMESGLVKIPFMPESDTTQNISEPVLKNLYEHIKDDLPKKGKQKQDLGNEPHLPTMLKNALEQFYSHYKKEWDRMSESGFLMENPPVFIIVCNNTSLSSEVYRYIAGYVKEDGNAVPGIFELFSNYDQQTKIPYKKPPTLIIDSESLEETNQITDDFKKVFEPEIAQFKADYRTFHPDRSVESLTDGDILREVVNTVGKQGSLGSHIRCVVSVSMLTEGWDANTVTHIMGIRAFGSQLLCEQVVGRALRRTNYVVSEKGKNAGKFLPEYAHVIGVPFSFFKGGKTIAPSEEAKIYQVKALPEREQFEIHFPNITGYRIENESETLEADFSKVGNFEIDGTKYPVETTLGTPFSDEIRQLTLDQLRSKRKQELVYYITKSLISTKYPDYEINRRFQYFPVLKGIVEEWLDTKIMNVGDAFTNMLFHYDSQKVCNHIMLGIEAMQKEQQQISPIFNYYNPIGSTKYVNGSTAREVYPTKKSHVNVVVADTKSWEQIAAKSLDEMPEVISYVKNSFLGFAIPYVKDGKEDKLYYPDFIARIKTVKGSIVNLIIEITGRNKEDKDIKKRFVEDKWLPAINQVRYEHPEIKDEWAFIEIADDIRFFKNVLNDFIQSR